MFTTDWRVEEAEWARAADFASEHASSNEHERWMEALTDSLLGGVIRFLDDGEPYPVTMEPSGYAIERGLHDIVAQRLRRSTAPFLGFADGFYTSILELANIMAAGLGPEDFMGVRRKRGFIFKEMESPFSLAFETAGPGVSIYATDDVDWRVDVKFEVPAAEFRPGVDRFMSEVSEALAQRTPNLAAWSSSQPIMAWRSLPGERRP